MSSYTPKIWVGGETVTAGHLNRIEQGIAALEADLKDYADNSGGGVVIIKADILSSDSPIEHTVN